MSTPLQYTAESTPLIPSTETPDISGSEKVIDAVKSSVKAATTPASDDFTEAWQELQAWDQPFNSAIVLFSLVSVFWLTYGEDGYSVVSLVLLAILVRIGLVAAARLALAKTAGVPKLKSISAMVERVSLTIESFLVIPSPDQVTMFVDGVAKLVKAKLNKWCKVLVEATEPSEEGHRKLQIVVSHAVAALIVLYFVDFWTLVFLYSVHRLCWPAVYSRHQEKIDDAYQKGWTKAEPFVEAGKAKAKELAKAGIEKMEQVSAQAKAKIQERLNKGQADSKTD